MTEDENLRRALYEMSLLLEQQIQIAGNFSHQAAIRPKLHEIRQLLYPGSAPTAPPPYVPPITTQHPVQMAMAGPTFVPFTGTLQPASAVPGAGMGGPSPGFGPPPGIGAPPVPPGVGNGIPGPAPAPPQQAGGPPVGPGADVGALMSAYGVDQDHPGCAACGRRPADLLASGHAPNCAGVRAAIQSVA
jgi:hypothetical protein